MQPEKCPLCDSPCIIKVISTGDERWCEVDVCRICGTMYPRDKETKPKTTKAKTASKKTKKK